jgi:predicted metalloendopeptidase
MSWATRSKARDAAIKNQVKTDPHSPGMYRAYVPVTGMWTRSIKLLILKKGDGMYIAPENRVKIW